MRPTQPEDAGGAVMVTQRPDAISDELVERFLSTLTEAHNTRDADLAASLCAPNVVVDDHGADDVMVGNEALRELFGGIFRVVPDIKFERIGPHFLSEDRTVLCARWRTTGTRAEGDQFKVETIGLYRFRDGLVSEYTIFVRDRDWLGSQVP